MSARAFVVAAALASLVRAEKVEEDCLAKSNPDAHCAAARGVGWTCSARRDKVVPVVDIPVPGLEQAGVCAYKPKTTKPSLVLCRYGGAVGVVELPLPTRTVSIVDCGRYDGDYHDEEIKKALKLLRAEPMNKVLYVMGPDVFMDMVERHRSSTYDERKPAAKVGKETGGFVSVRTDATPWRGSDPPEHERLFFDSNERWKKRGSYPVGLRECSDCDFSPTSGRMSAGSDPDLAVWHTHPPGGSMTDQPSGSFGAGGTDIDSAPGDPSRLGIMVYYDLERKAYYFVPFSRGRGWDAKRYEPAYVLSGQGPNKDESGKVVGWSYPRVRVSWLMER